QPQCTLRAHCRQGVTQHSLPSGRCPLLGPVFHRLDRASFSWRTHSITSLARAISVAGTSRPSAFAVLRLIARLTPAPETRAVTVGSVRACLRRSFERPTGASW